MREKTIALWSETGDGPLRALVAVVAFGLLTALWASLWVPSAPLP